MNGSSPGRRIWLGSLTFAAIVALATLGYAAAGSSLLDSLYMVIITVFGVGYGEIIPTGSSAGLRVLTILLIVGGTTAAVYTVSATVQFMTQGEIERLIGVRRKMRDIKACTGHTIICGFGRMGQILARDLAHEKLPFIVIELNPDNVALAEKSGYLVIGGDATDEEMLLAGGIEKASHVACILSDDSQNVFVALSARNLQPGIHIVARGEVPSTEHKLRQAGADSVVLPPAIGGSLIAEIIVEREHARLGLTERVTVVKDGESDAGIALCAFHVAESGMVTKDWIAASRKRTEVAFAVVGVRGTDKVLKVASDEAHVLQAGEEILLACAASEAPVLRAGLEAEDLPV